MIVLVHPCMNSPRFHSNRMIIQPINPTFSACILLESLPYGIVLFMISSSDNSYNSQSTPSVANPQYQLCDINAFRTEVRRSRLQREREMSEDNSHIDEELEVQVPVCLEPRPGNKNNRQQEGQQEQEQQGSSSRFKDDINCFTDRLEKYAEEVHERTLVKRSSNPRFEPQYYLQHQDSTLGGRMEQILGDINSFHNSEQSERQKTKEKAKEIQQLILSYSQTHIHEQKKSTPKIEFKIYEEQSFRKPILVQQPTEHQIQLERQPIEREKRKQRVQWVDRQEHLRRINQSPAKPNISQYLSQPRQFHLPIKPQPSTVEHKVEYQQQGRLRQDFLRQAASKSKQRHSSVQTQQFRWNQQIRNNPSVHHITTIPKSRSKIFDNLPFTEEIARQNAPSRASITPPRIQLKTPPKTTTNKQLSIAPNTFSSHTKLTPPVKPSYAVKLQQQKTQSKQHNFRIVISPAKPQPHPQSSKTPPKPTKMFPSPEKREIKKSELAQQRIDLNALFDRKSMPADLQAWFQSHLGQIASQTDKILSYDLISRYMNREEMQLRLRQFVGARIEPKRWVLLMVDGVYARLKDRYFTTDA